jgi:amino acid transporter
MRNDSRDEFEEYYDDYDAYEEYEEPQPYYLTARDLMFFCLAFMTPAATAVVYGAAQKAAHGALAASYLVAAVFVFFTLLSYRRLSRAFHGEGSILSFVGGGIHRRAGRYAGWTALVFYVFAAGAFFMIGSDVAADAFAPVPRTVWIVLLAIVSGVLVLFGQRLSSLALTALGLGVIGITGIFILVCFMASSKGLAPEGSTASASFAGTGAGFGALMSGAGMAFLSFLGFGSVTTLHGETEHPRYSMSKAITFSFIIAALFMFFQTLAAARMMPDYGQLDARTAAFDIASAAGGDPMRNLLSLSVLLAAFAIGIAAITAASRMLVRLIGEMPVRRKGAHSSAGGFLSDILPQTGTPPMHVLVCLAVAVAIALAVPAGKSMLMFDLARYAGMICFMLINAASLIHFRFRKHDPVIIRSVVIPATGLIASLWAWISIDPDSFGIGSIIALAGVIVIASLYLYERLALGGGAAGATDAPDAD